MPRYIEEMVSQQVRRSEMARQRQGEEGEPELRPVVTISRRMGSGARIVAQKLAADLGWSLWGKELLDAMAQDADVSRRVVETFDEKTISELEIFARSALGDHELGGFLYPRHLARAVAAIAKLGNAVILGRGANFLLPDALNVRIDAPEEVRILNMMKYEGLSRSEAESRVRGSDRDRFHFLERVFGRDRVSQCQYDLTICMEKFDTDAAAEIIKAAVRAQYGVPT